MEKICIWCKAGKHFIFLAPLLYFYYIYVCVCIYNLFKLVLYVKMSWAFLAAPQRKTWYSGNLNIHLGSLRTLRRRALMETYSSWMEIHPDLADSLAWSSERPWFSFFSNIVDLTWHMKYFKIQRQRKIFILVIVLLYTYGVSMMFNVCKHHGGFLAASSLHYVEDFIKMLITNLCSKIFCIMIY